GSSSRACQPPGRWSRPELHVKATGGRAPGLSGQGRFFCGGKGLFFASGNPPQAPSPAHAETRSIRLTRRRGERGGSEAQRGWFWVSGAAEASWRTQGSLDGVVCFRAGQGPRG